MDNSNPELSPNGAQLLPINGPNMTTDPKLAQLTPTTIDFIRLILMDDINLDELPDDNDKFEVEFWKLFPNIPHKELRLVSCDWNGIYIEAENLGEFNVGLVGLVFGIREDFESVKKELREILRTRS